MEAAEAAEAAETAAGDEGGGTTLWTPVVKRPDSKKVIDHQVAIGLELKISGTSLGPPVPQYPLPRNVTL